MKLVHSSSDTPQERMAAKLASVLVDFRVQGVIRDIHVGPVVTLYEFEPSKGTRASRIFGLAPDIARSMSVAAIRISPVDGKNTIGFEIPNVIRSSVPMSELINSSEWTAAKGSLPMILGKDITGHPVVIDLATAPHLLIAGTTGSGKSVGIHSMIVSLLSKFTAAQCRFIMIDPKMLELSTYNGIPHLLTPVITQPNEAIAALNWALWEMERRYKAMSKLGVRDIAQYNARIINAQANDDQIIQRMQTGFDDQGQAVFEDRNVILETIPYIVVVIDEVADLMAVSGKELDDTVQRLAQMARAAGIHMIMATQRPSSDVITGTIKANFPTRIAFTLQSAIDSRIVLGENGAEKLLGKGDMLLMQRGNMTRVHGVYVDNAAIEKLVDFLKKYGQPVYVEEVTGFREEILIESQPEKKQKHG